MSDPTVADEADYSAEVSQLIEFGTRGGDTLGVSWQEWRKDAFQTYNKPLISLEKLVNMRRTDGQARALCNLITLPIRLALQQGQWVAPPEGNADQEVDFANLMWNMPPAQGGMTTSKSFLIDQMLLSLFDGFAAFELVSQIPKVGPLKGFKTLQKMAYRDPRTVTILQDEHGGYAGFRQVAVSAKGEIKDTSLGPGKTVLFTVGGHENPFYGISYLESAYPHYEAKMKWYYLAEMAGQFAAVPGRIGTVPRNAQIQDAQAFRKAMENFYFNTSMMLKEGYKVEAFQSSTGFQFLPFIEHHNMMMAKSVLASFFESDQRTVLVENSTQDASADIFLLSMETLASNFGEILSNHVMPKYIKDNFKGSNKFPIFKPGPLSDSTRKQIMGLFEKVAVSGILNTTPEMVRELEKHVSRELGLDVDYEDIEQREEEAAQQQAQQAEALAAQAQMQTLDQERVAQGGIPNASAGGAATGVNQSTNFKATQTTPKTKGKVPAAANNGISLSYTDVYDLDYEDAVDMLYSAAQRVLTEMPLENHPVDEGVFYE